MEIYYSFCGYVEESTSREVVASLLDMIVNASPDIGYVPGIEHFG